MALFGGTHIAVRVESYNGSHTRLTQIVDLNKLSQYLTATNASEILLLCPKVLYILSNTDTVNTGVKHIKIQALEFHFSHKRI